MSLGHDDESRAELEEVQVELLEVREYLITVEVELSKRQEAVSQSLQNVKSLEQQLRQVSIERALRMGRVSQLQSVDEFRREIQRRIASAQKKHGVLEEDLQRAVERREHVLTEIEVLSQRLEILMAISE